MSNSRLTAFLAHLLLCHETLCFSTARSHLRFEKIKKWVWKEGGKRGEN